MEIKVTGQWRWRTDEISMKTFKKLNLNDRQEYLDLVKGLPKEQRSTMDEILINQYHLDKPNHTPNYFEL